MEKIKYVLFSIICCLVLVSCKKKIKPYSGGIDIVSNVYFNPKKSLDSMKTFIVSKLNYKGDTIIELIPNMEIPVLYDRVLLLKDSLCWDLGDTLSSRSKNIKDIISKTKPTYAHAKGMGAVYLKKDWIPNYLNKIDLKDTILFGKRYKRFQINSPQSFSIYYIHPTDTILPYQLYPKVAEQYGGRIERIDSYNKEKNIFMTMQILLKEKWDKEAKDIFDFNQFLEKKESRNKNYHKDEEKK
ncbi:hypothetical protein [Riemerella columbipharyngis]|uniref:Lipoprotein n=1 Tax=Riemerella columbipharyngis TaxID=1071918 RepID=A0A1G6ZC96_9FLAO|nr:hypothetical protein [Riemerella columbipharyngis]SDE00279.1 hypothetical protein SAMN05421544_10238 [Riemerella columbipharyngis]